MPVTKLKLEERTRLRKGIFDKTRDGARELGIVTDLTPGDGIWKEAADLAASQAGDWHDQITDLPLLDVMTTDVSADQALVLLTYGRTETTTPPWPAFEGASSHPYTEHRVRRFFNSDADGEITVNSGWVDPRPRDDEGNVREDVYGWISVYTRTEKRPVHRVSVRTVLDSNPLNTVSDLYGHYNDDAVSIAGISVPPGSLRFRGVRSEPIPAPNGLKWFVEYVFDMALRNSEVGSDFGGFVEFKQVWRQVIDEIDEFGRIIDQHFEIRIRPDEPSPRTSFSGQFPIHDSQNPGSFTTGP